MPKILINIPGGEQIDQELTGASITIGRNEDNTIVVDEGSISGNHAEFVQSGDGYLLRDLGSTNGTTVNGEGASDTPLKNGDTILFGSVEAKFEGAAAPAAEEEEEPLVLGEAEDISADLADSSARPADFASISPFPKKKKKKDPLGSLAIALGLISVIACIGLAVFATVMRAS